MLSSLRPPRRPALAAFVGVVACVLATGPGLHAATLPDGAQGAATFFRIEPPDNLVDDGSDGAQAFGIIVDSVRRRGDAVAFDVQSAAPGAPLATHQTVLVDCSRRLRGLQPAEAASDTRPPFARPRAGSREARELALACTLPQGPRSRWFAGVIVSADGVVVAPHARTQGCRELSAGVAGAPLLLDVIAHEDDITLLRIRGSGGWSVMPAAGVPLADGRSAVTLLGLSGTQPRASAAFVEQAGSNADDPGWPQVHTLSGHALSEGLVWDASGTAVGLALAVTAPVDRRGRRFVRMLPASQVRLLLQRHQLDWLTAPAHDTDSRAAMRLALSATLPLTCTR